MCSSGYFGLDCKSSCSRNCIHNEPCNYISGVCPSGCQDGFVGAQCKSCKNIFSLLKKRDHHKAFGEGSELYERKYKPMHIDPMKFF